MFKTIFKIGTLAGATAGISTLLLACLLHAIYSYYGNIFYLVIVFVGDMILYSVPAILGGAAAGLLLGAFGAGVVSWVAKGNVEPRKGALYGGIVGGILIGVLLPVWLGFGYLY